MRKIFQILKSLVKRVDTFLIERGEIIKYRLRVIEYLRKNPQPGIPKNTVREIKEFYGSKGFPGIALDWHKFYGGVQGQYYKECIPNTVFYSKIEKFLNRVEYKALQDKNILDRIFSGAQRPVTLVKNINGFFYINDTLVSREAAIRHCAENGRFIIKPSLDTGGGKNVRLINQDLPKGPEREKMLKELFVKYSKDFIVQEVVEQSPQMAAFNPTSLNTIRITTYLNQDGPVVLHAILRMGKEGSATDNISGGGVCAGIDVSGRLRDETYNKYKIIIPKVIDGVPLSQMSVPNYEAVKEMVKGLHLQVPFFRLVAWDIALDRDNQPVLIEYNVTDQGVDSQAHEGPYLGNYTDEILTEYKAERDSK